MSDSVVVSNKRSFEASELVYLKLKDNFLFVVFPKFDKVPTGQMCFRERCWPKF